MDTTTENASESSAMEHQECVAEATVEIFKSACGVKLEPAEDREHPNEGVIVAVISILGEADWSVFLGLPESTATAVTLKFAGFEIPFESDDMGDAVGELTNILGGEVKRLLVNKGVEVVISLPSVIRAGDFHVLVQRDTSVAKYCYTSEVGDLWTGVISR